MGNNKQYTYLFLIPTFFLLSCDQTNKAQNHLVSTIISTDSVIIYSGKLEENTPFQKIDLNEKKFKEIIADKKYKTNKPITIFLKLSSEGGQAGILGCVEKIKVWSMDLGITSFEFTDGDKMDIARFNADSGTWRFMDSLSSEPLQLFMPKDEENDTVRITESTLTLLTLRNKILVYKSDKIDETATYGYENICQLLMKERKRSGDKFFVVIKPAEDASYQNTVDILDEMKICNVKKYAMVDLSPVEKETIKKFHSVTER